MKLLSFLILILFSSQYAIAQEGEVAIEKCQNLETTLDKKTDYLNNLRLEIDKEEDHLRDTVRSINNTEVALEYLVERCEENGRGCSSTNRKIDALNDDKRFYRNKIRQIDEMITEYNDGIEYLRTLEEGYQIRVCRVFLM